MIQSRKNTIKGYYFITDSTLSVKGNESDVKNAIAAGVKVIQYRNKNSLTKDLYEEAFALIKHCFNAVFLINDRIDVALAVDADGVHLGQEDMPYEVARRLLGKNKILGITVHSLEEAMRAQRIGANYIGVSPIFSTSTKKDAGKPVGVELITNIKKVVTIPVIAIGGITLSNAPEIIEANADGLCAISEVITKSSVRKEIEKFQKLFH